MFKSIFFALFIIASVSGLQTITLNSTNNVVLRGVVDNESIDNVIYDIMIKNPEYLYIDSFGGSVMAGNRLIQYLKTKPNIKCIADKFYSMAFVILQACGERIILPSSTAMQHQQSLRVQGDLFAINHYLEMVNAIESDLNQLQAQRLNVTEEYFRNITANEWWLYSKDIIKHNVADSMSLVECTPELVKTNITTKEHFFFDEIEYTYSACPIINSPIDVAYNVKKSE